MTGISLYLSNNLIWLIRFELNVLDVYCFQCIVWWASYRLYVIWNTYVSMTHINEMKDNIFVIILGVMLASTALTTLPIESHADRRQLPHGTYTAIGKLLACSDVKATTVIGILIREGLGCGFTGGIALSANMDASLSASREFLWIIPDRFNHWITLL